jgi:hypothetical protein
MSHVHGAFELGFFRQIGHRAAVVEMEAKGLKEAKKENRGGGAYCVMRAMSTSSGSIKSRKGNADRSLEAG